MRQSLNEIQKIFKNHNYDLNNIILENIKKFKLISAFSKYGVKKNQGFAAIEIISILLFLPLLHLKNVHHLYRSHYNHCASMQKDVLYRFKNNHDIDWRRILLHVAKKFDILTGTKGAMADDSVLILDDTTHMKTGSFIEKVSRVFDHTIRKHVLGFKNLTCVHYDGKSYKVLDFSLHSEKALEKSKRKKQYDSNADSKAKLATRLKECETSKIENGIKMVKRAAKNGFVSRYLITDAWFACEKMLKEVRKIKNGAMHVLCAVRKDKRKYNFASKSLNANELLKKMKTDIGKAKRNRQNKLHYYEVVVEYKGMPAKLFFAKGKHQRHWKLFLSTDTSVSFNRFCKLYSIRWGIEVIFKECKGLLRIGKCQSRSFSAQIADISICYLLYNMLVYQKRIGDYNTTGSLFEHFSEQLQEKTLAEKIWNLLVELLEFIVDKVTFEQCYIESYQQLEESTVFKDVKQIFESSFLSAFLQNA